MSEITTERTPIIVMGLGNYLFGDEGIGIHALQKLHQEGGFPPEVELIDGGTLGLNLLDVLETAKKLLIIDCVNVGQSPGTLVRLEGDAIPRYLSQKVSVHQLGFSEVLALAEWRQSLPEEMVLLGIQPAELDWGTELSPIVAETFPILTKECRKQVDAWLQD